MKKTVAVLYGLGEGSQIGRGLVLSLRKKEFEVIKDAAQADCIIAHSGGILFLPEKYKAKLFLFTGVTTAFEDSVFTLQYRKLKLDFAHAVEKRIIFPWMIKTFWNICYLLGTLSRTRHMFRVAHGDEPLIPTIIDAKVIVVSYKGDPWSGENFEKDKAAYPHYEFILHPGVHDDIWIHPEYYVKLLQQA